MARKFKRATGSTKSATGPVGELAGKISAIASSLSEQPSAKQVMDSAQQIWLAGLGAFSKAQNEGKKVFETLVAQGAKIEERTRHVAEATIETAKDQATKTIDMATGKFDKLEQVFESRVHSSLNRLGVLTAKDVEALSIQVGELSEAVRALLAQEKRSAARPAAKKPAPKRTVAAKKPIAKAKKVVKAVARKATPKTARK
ncbi:MAG: phasin family protein [Burkholderiales bacterium]|nr:phasin family protein [Burkholderiales bacterium]